MKTLQTALIAVAVWIASNWAWERFNGDGAGANGDGSGGDGSGSGAGGAGGSGSGSGAGGAGGAGAGGDYAALAAAIELLAAGVRLPNIRTASLTLAAGTTELVAGEGGKRVCVLAYILTGSGAINASFKSAASVLWALGLDVSSGKSGANLATSWPAFLFATDGGAALSVTTDAACVVTVTYWLENS